MVTNVEADHLDIYRDLEDITLDLRRLRARRRGHRACAPTTRARARSALPASAEVIRYGSNSPDARLVASDIRSDGQSTTFAVTTTAMTSATSRCGCRDTTTCRMRWPRSAPGSRSASRSMRCAADCCSLAESSAASSAFANVAGVTIVDDYAHHPTEIAATLQAARASYPGRRIVAAFQPHLFSRTRDFSRCVRRRRSRVRTAVFLDRDLSGARAADRWRHVGSGRGVDGAPGTASRLAGRAIGAGRSARRVRARGRCRHHHRRRRHHPDRARAQAAPGVAATMIVARAAAQAGLENTRRLCCSSRSSWPRRGALRAGGAPDGFLPRPRRWRSAALRYLQPNDIVARLKSIPPRHCGTISSRIASESRQHPQVSDVQIKSPNAGNAGGDDPGESSRRR